MRVTGCWGSGERAKQRVLKAVGFGWQLFDVRPGLGRSLTGKVPSVG